MFGKLHLLSWTAAPHCEKKVNYSYLTLCVTFQQALDNGIDIDIFTRVGHSFCVTLLFLTKQYANCSSFMPRPFTKINLFFI